MLRGFFIFLSAPGGQLLPASGITETETVAQLAVKSLSSSVKQLDKFLSREALGKRKKDIDSAGAPRKKKKTTNPDVGVLVMPGKIQHVIQSQHAGRNLGEVHCRVDVVLRRKRREEEGERRSQYEIQQTQQLYLRGCARVLLCTEIHFFYWKEKKKQIAESYVLLMQR